MVEQREIATMDAPLRIVEGRVYRYVQPYPKGCEGELYRVKKFIQDVPSYQEKVLVEAITGPDRGLWFTCSLTNFATRYRPAVEEIITPAIVPPSREMAFLAEGSGF